MMPLLSPPPAPAPALPAAASLDAAGVATMPRDGTLILDLRAEGPGGAVGDARLVDPPAHPGYGRMLAHLGGLRSGESKPAPAFDDAKDKLRRL